MRTTTFLHKKLLKALVNLHQLRAKTLIEVAMSLLHRTHLTLTSLAQYLEGDTAVKHKIKRVDRLLGNQKLHQEHRLICQGLVEYFFSYLERLYVLVDWTGCCGRDYHVLQASLVFEGRSIPLYQELHPEKKQENPKVHKLFLKRLKKIIPVNKQVVIITDSGFCTPWFEEVQALGWDFVGRLGSKIHFCRDVEEVWQSIKTLHNRASGHPRDEGKVKLAKTKKLPLACRLVSYKAYKKGRKKVKTKACPLYPDAEKRYRKMNKTPWILATSLQESACIVKNLYKKRMQVEENFRDVKNPRWGFGLRYSGTRQKKRLEVLLLIGMIGNYLVWLIGMTAEFMNLHRQFQSNSLKTKRVLCWLNLARQIMFHAFKKIRLRYMEQALSHFYYSYEEIATC